MPKTNLLIVGLALLAVSLSCKQFLPSSSSDTKYDGPPVDFTTPGRSLDVKIQLDAKQTASAKIPVSGGSLSLKTPNGNTFTLDIPANALGAETEITITAVKSLDGAPLDGNSPAAVQLEPSGLRFKEFATLTIVPAKEIPGKEQIAFGYEGEGKDYHLAIVDPKSRELKIKLMHFSGAGVGSGSDAAWAANLMVQAAGSEARLTQEFGEATQDARRRMLTGDEDSPELNESIEKAVAAMDDYEDQVLLKEIAAAELDCKHVQKAIDSLTYIGRGYALLGYPPKPSWDEKMKRLLKIADGCKWEYQVTGGLDDWQTNTRVCDLMKPFKLTGAGITMQLSGGLSGTYTYAGGQFNAQGSGTYKISLPNGIGKAGTMTGSGEGSAEGYDASGTEKYTLTPIGPCT